MYVHTYTNAVNPQYPNFALQQDDQSSLRESELFDSVALSVDHQDIADKPQTDIHAEESQPLNEANVKTMLESMNQITAKVESQVNKTEEYLIQMKKFEAKILGEVTELKRHAEEER